MSDLLSRIVGRASSEVSSSDVSRVEPVLKSRYETAAPILPPETFEPPAIRRAERIESPHAQPAESAKHETVESRSNAPVEKSAFEHIRHETVETRLTAPSPVPEPETAPDPQYVPHQEEVVRPPAAPSVAVVVQQIHESLVDTIPAAAEKPPAQTHTVREYVPIGIPRATAPPVVSVSPQRNKPAGLELLEPADVQVTIGHVELRMVAPPRPPAQPRRPVQPRLSLDDYLRRRNGGGK